MREYKRASELTKKEIEALAMATENYIKEDITEEQFDEAIEEIFAVEKKPIMKAAGVF